MENENFPYAVLWKFFSINDRNEAGINPSLQILHRKTAKPGDQVGICMRCCFSSHPLFCAQHGHHFRQTGAAAEKTRGNNDFVECSFLFHIFFIHERGKNLVPCLFLRDRYRMFAQVRKK